MSKKAMLYVTTDSLEDREDELETWLDDVHIPEVLEHVEEFRSATCYRRAAGSPSLSDQPGYCIAYEIEADDPAAAVAKLHAAAQDGKLHWSDANQGTKLFLWELRTPRVSNS